MELTSQQKKQLLLLVHSAIKSGFGSIVKESQLDDNDESILKSKLGTFVTLTINNKLRGCIGYVQSDQELYKTIKDAAYQASFNDPRFPPLTEEEYKNIIVEISILSKPFPLNNYNDIIVGRHGLILDDIGRTALLLPQVPIKHKMDRDGFLSALCNKAGLYPEYWREKDLKLKAFTAFVFSEKDKDLQ